MDHAGGWFAAAPANNRRPQRVAQLVAKVKNFMEPSDPARASHIQLLGVGALLEQLRLLLREIARKRSRTMYNIS